MSARVGKLYGRLESELPRRRSVSLVVEGPGGAEESVGVEVFCDILLFDLLECYSFFFFVCGILSERAWDSGTEKESVFLLHEKMEHSNPDHHHVANPLARSSQYVTGSPNG